MNIVAVVLGVLIGVIGMTVLPQRSSTSKVYEPRLAVGAALIFVGGILVGAGT